MSRPYASIRIIFADDHEVVREGFQVMMKKQTEIEIIAEAKNGEHLLRLVKQLKPDVVITDIEMPRMNGIEAAREITKEFPDVGIIAFSMHNEESLIVDMLKAGASGYLLKNARRSDVIAAVKSVYRGEPYYCRETNIILHTIREKNNKIFRKKSRPEFSEKELTIMKLVCEELPNHVIAEKLGISKRTVDGYRRQIIEKTNAKNTAGIVLYAIRHKIYQVK